MRERSRFAVRKKLHFKQTAFYLQNIFPVSGCIRDAASYVPVDPLTFRYNVIEV
jgi:hypothetical protein